MAHTYLDFVYGSLEKDAQMNNQPYCSKILSQDLKKKHETVFGKKTTTKPTPNFWVTILLLAFFF